MSKKKIILISFTVVIAAVLAGGISYLIRSGIVSINLGRTAYKDPLTGNVISQGEFENKTAAQLYDDAVEYNKKGDYKNAAAFLNEAMKKDNNDGNVDVLRELAVSYYNIKNYDEAIAIYNKIIKISPNDAAAYNELGNVYRDKGDTGQAEDSYKKAIEVDDTYILAYNNLAMIYVEKNDMGAARSVIQDGLSKNQNNVQLESILKSLQ